MAVKLAPWAIRVNSLAPGPFDTSMLDHVRKSPEAMAKHNAQVPLGRPGGADDVKGAALFLASDVDGGISAVYPVKKLA